MAVGKQPRATGDPAGATAQPTIQVLGLPEARR